MDFGSVKTEELLKELEYRQRTGEEINVINLLSDENLLWIIREYDDWRYKQWHCDVNEQCTFKKWLDKRNK